MTCDKCHSPNITHYKQRRADGVWVVTARCENGHHPITGKPFYPISQFNIAALPVLGETNDKQPELFPRPEREEEPPRDLIEFIEQKRRAQATFTFKRHS